MSSRWTVGLLLLAACEGQGREERHDKERVAVPEHPEMSLVPPTATTPLALELGNGKLASPETVVHDLDQDVYFVSNINGNPMALDHNGYISKVSPSGELLDRFFIDGRTPNVELHAPRGMAIGGDTLYVADAGGVRLFDRKTGAQQGSWAVPGSRFLNGVAIDAQGRVLVTDTGIDLLPTGPVKSGPYVIYAFDASGHSTVLAKGDALQGPNGIVAGAAGIFVVEFMGDEHGVYALDAKGGKQLLGTLPFGQLDGLVLLPDGTMLVSSWLANGVFQFVPGQPARLAVEHLMTPAGIGYDVLRSRILIPEVLGQRVHIEPWAPPEASLKAMEDRWGAR